MPNALSVASLVVGAGNKVTDAQQKAGSVTVTGTLDAPLEAGEAVEIVLPDGEIAQGVATSDGMSFSLTAELRLAEMFGVSGTVSAYVVGTNGVKGAVTTQAYVADSQRSIAVVSATPDDLTASGLGQLSLSGDGHTVAFDVFPTGSADSTAPATPLQTGVYLENLQTQAVTLVAADGSEASVSNHGQEVAYVVSDGQGLQVHVKSFVSGLDLLISATPRSEGTVGANGASDRPSLSADGQTVAFESTATDLVNFVTSKSQIYVARGLSDVAGVSLVSAPEDGDGTQQGDGDSLFPNLSADATTVVFTSTSDNLLGVNSVYDGKFVGTYQIYVKALADNALTGLRAGQVTLVTGLADGTIADGESLYAGISGTGRYVVFQSSADNLVTGATLPVEASEIYVKDLLTGVIRLVSASSEGQAADQGASSATISADGRVVVFESFATNLLPPGSVGPNAAASQQFYAKDLVTGGLTLLSAAGYTPGNADSGRSAALSADGSVAAFSSDASNLVAATDTAAPGSFHGYVTGAPTTPGLTIQSSAASTTAASVVFTGTVDAADAGQAIIVTDTADPGFAPVTAIVTSTSDPYVDQWTATVGLTVPGLQTVSATLNGVSGTVVAATADIDYDAALAVTIGPVGDNGALSAAALQAGETTVVAGTAAGAVGQILHLSLQGAGGPLLALGTAAVGTGGAWSVAVANNTLDANPSGDYALVAEVTDTQGQLLQGTAAVSLAVPASTTLYDIKFTYPDGSFYSGTLAAKAGSVYTPGQTIAAAMGQYTILSDAGATMQLAGTVITSIYYDVTTAASYTGIATGGTGLGSETGLVDGVKFGGGFEAKLAPTTLYDFYFKYDDGSYYYGTAAADSMTYSYTVGESIAGNGGAYYIYGSAGATTKATGIVDVAQYYDVTSGMFYISAKYAAHVPSGTMGVGSELDSTSGSQGTQFFGEDGLHEAKQAPNTLYDYYFKYVDNSYYYGTVVAGPSDGIYVGQTKSLGLGGYYYIYGSAGTTTLIRGTVTTSSYFDVSTDKVFVPTRHAAGLAAGSAGLGSELDFTTGGAGVLSFGEAGLHEAEQAPNTIYDFYFRYTDSSYYYGTVVAGPGEGLYVGEELTATRGYYYIYGSAGGTAQAAGIVRSSSYYDVSSGSVFVPTEFAANQPSGTTGLGTELDFTSGSQGVVKFGDAGLYEAKQAPSVLYDYYFKYLDNSYYYGMVVAGPNDTIHVGEEIDGTYGYYYVYGSAGVATQPSNTVTVSGYYDVTTNKTYVPTGYGAGKSAGKTGLGQEVDTTFGAQGLQQFGEAGALEAKQAASTLSQFYFKYHDNSYYYGTVAGGLAYVYKVGETIATPDGYYYIYGPNGATSQIPGTVTDTGYFDVSTGAVYSPVDGGAGKPSGTKGLESDLDYTTGAQGLLAFGYGGTYEARQGPSELFDFRFTYKDGSFYTGTVAAGGRFDLFTVGEDLNTTNGRYDIGADLGNTPQATGTTHVDRYFDSTTGATYVTTSFLAGTADGDNGLLYELDSVTGPNGLRSFGQGGVVEAKEGVFSPFRLTLNVSTLVFDGPIAGATIGYFDPAASPGVVRIDLTQPTAFTDGQGRYALGAGSGPLVLTGGTDTATGLAFHGILEAPANASVLSPITTLITEVARQGGSLSDSGIAAAQTLVATALGLSTSIDLDSYAAASILQHPLSSPDDPGTAEDVFKAGAQLLDVETLIDAAGGSSEAAIVHLAAAIASKAVTDVTDFKALVERAGLTPDAVSAVEGITAANIVAVDAQLAGVTDPDLIFDLITGSSIDQQGDTARLLAAADGNDAVLVGTYVQALPVVLAADDLKALNSSIACYVGGTRILTDRGEVVVERLEIGDRVVTHDGRIVPVRWVGRRSYAGHFLKSNSKVQPVRLARGSLGAGLPRRDLLVSPCHAMYLDEMLIPASCLVNGVTIVRDRARERVDYYHIELDEHDIVLAEGAASETFIDDDSRQAFHNAAEFDALYPQAPKPSGFFAPRVESGYALETIRRKLAAVGETEWPCARAKSHIAAMSSVGGLPSFGARDCRSAAQDERAVAR